MSSNETVDSLATTNEAEENKQQRIVDSIYEYVTSSVLIDVASNLHQIIKTEGTAQPLFTLLTNDISTKRSELFPELYENKSEEEIERLMKQYAVDYPRSNRKERPSDIVSNTSSSNTTANDVNNNNNNNNDNDNDNDNQSKDGDDDDDDEEEENDQPTAKKRRRKKNSDDDDSDYEMEDDKDDDEKYDDSNKNRKSSKAGDQLTPGGTTASTAPNNGTDNGTTVAKSTTTTAHHVDIWGKIQPKESKDLTCRCRLCGRHVSTSRFANHLDKCMGLSTRPLAGSATRG
jgi:hypothetical protein